MRSDSEKLLSLLEPLPTSCTETTSTFKTPEIIFKTQSAAFYVRQQLGPTMTQAVCRQHITGQAQLSGTGLAMQICG
jgi:hypothetical protein